jgi:rhodanese-related sulfurtransferase
MRLVKRCLLQAVVIVIISGTLGIVVNVFRADGIPLVESWQEKVLNEELAAGLPAVSLLEAKEAFASGEAIFVDARDPEFFQLGHIPGAVNLPMTDFDLIFPELKERLLAAPRIITYCDGSSCEMSVELTERLLFAGMHWVEVFIGGMQQWQSTGQPIETVGSKQ